ncbi:IS701 family transposase [Streptomyces alkaliterrae]|uniref:Transposase n=1 Tax=Streptomyces alkaliterrae TaxID=2213162 RepID=A0A7W3WM04_9ACTN|nr:transposase [Streptomyces alkaliterrae]MBB1254808.1 transposase [Streptomyces alkaliterrae]MBB1258449.1 transposase [Streptomyces alkaliterrae]
MNARVSTVRDVGSEAVARELCPTVFASLRRSDQRRKAEQYVLGLLTVPGRKSIRKIAARTRGDADDHPSTAAVEQSLQHFVSCSTWPWADVRAALARHMESALRPTAWVVRPLVIPKAGSHSVGVARRTLPGLGSPVNCQEAHGLWLANEVAGAPVNWRLQIPTEWLDSPTRRREGGIPDDEPRLTPDGAAANTALEVAAGWGLTRRPIVVDLFPTDRPTHRPGDAPHGAPGGASTAAVSVLSAAGLPFVVRIGADTDVGTPADIALSGYRRRTVAAHHVMSAVHRLRRAVEWTDPASGLVRTSLVAKVPVNLTGGTVRRAAGGERPLVLVGEWDKAGGRPARFWLTDLVDAPAGVLLRLTKLTRRVDRDLVDLTDEVGVRDFEGRTYPGWHRHTTLASVAHAVRLLATAHALHPAAAARVPLRLPATAALRTG